MRLRFVFDDPGHPDFEMDLWVPEDEGARAASDADEALHEANRWMARMESLLRRPVAKPAPRRRPASGGGPAAAARRAPAAPQPAAATAPRRRLRWRALRRRQRLEDDPEDVIR